MLNSLVTIDGLLNAKEGEHYQFKEAKRRFDSDEAAQICCALANCGYCQELCANTTASLMKLVRRRPNRPRACSAWLPVSGPPVVRQGWRSHLRSPLRAAGGLLATPSHSSLLRVFSRSICSSDFILI